MSLPITTDDPIIVVLDQEGGWNAYSLREKPTDRDNHLFSLLVSMGGINESVTPGTWQFNAVGLDSQSIVISLEPSPESPNQRRILHRF